MEGGFQITTKQAWESKILNDLKKGSISEFEFNLLNEVLVSPFANIEDISEYTNSITSTLKLDNGWEIIEIANEEPTKENNSSIITSLKNGTNALKFRFDSELEYKDLETLFQDINPEYISLHLSGNSIAITNTFNFFQKKGYHLASINGSSQVAKDLIWNLTQHHFKTEIYPIDTNSPQTIAEGFRHIFENLRLHQNDNISLQQFSERFQIEIFLTDQYLENIALIKAIRLLWNHILRTFYLVDSRIKIITKNRFLSSNISAEESYIYASIYALSSACGGSDGIIINTLPNKKFSPSFQKRISRNLNHLLSLESKIDLVLDPLSGSYFIESAANEIAEKTWKIFHNKISTL